LPFEIFSWDRGCIAHGPNGSFLSQCKYALEIVNECGLLGAKPSDFPMEENHKLALVSGPSLVDVGRYQSLVGHLIYLTITRPYICHAVHVLSKFMQAPQEEHMNAPYRVLHYIKGTPNCHV